jgi:long-subunit acyl-CoA synthetase (AMP-forming)
MRVYTAVLFQFADFGCIEDVTLGLRWSPADFASEVMNRATALTAANIKPGSIVVIAHSGSARFFADLFAVWNLGCTAACIDAALTANEVETLIGFVEPSAVLVDEVTPAARTSAPVHRRNVSIRINE